METNTTPPNAPHWMDSERRFKFWEQNGISEKDRAQQIKLALAAYTDVPEWTLPDAENRFVQWCNWFSDFCFRVNGRFQLE